MNAVSRFSDLLEKDEISCLVESFHEYRILKDGSGQSSEELILTKELISAIAGVKARDLDLLIDKFLKMNVLSSSGDFFVLSSGQDIEKCLQILNMKRKRAGKLV